MTEDGPGELPDLAAGSFSSWRSAMQGALRGERGAEVPCGGCTACCTSAQFVHIGPDELDALDHIPAELRFPAPGLPDGHTVLGYDERGHCPMLVHDACSIYEHRPRACRTYDCRIFPATGTEPDPVDQPAIARRAARWRFTFAGEPDRTHHDAMVAAATFLAERGDELAPGLVPTHPSQQAVVALEVHEAFLRYDDETERASVVVPPASVVEVELRRRRRRRA